MGAASVEFPVRGTWAYGPELEGLWEGLRLEMIEPRRTWAGGSRGHWWG